MNAKHILSAAATAAALFAAAPAWATITFVDNPGNLCMLAGQPGGCEENIMFEKQAETPAFTVTGDTNQTNQPVIFDTTFALGNGSTGTAGTGQLIAADGLGQANIVCATPTGSTATPCGTGGGNGMQLTSLEMKPGNNTAWTDVLLNTDFGEGTENVFVTDNLGHNFQDMLGNGQNFLGIVASAGEVITDIQISQAAGSAGPWGWNDFKQPRVSGVCTLQGTTCDAVDAPEPTSLALLGSALGGLGLLWRRRRSRV